jgi:hypothetical protein
MLTSIIFIIFDLLSVTPALAIGVINPFWKFSTVFKCFTDTIILDDFKTALDKLSRHQRRQILPIGHAFNDDDELDLDDPVKQGFRKSARPDSFTVTIEQVEGIGQDCAQNCHEPPRPPPLARSRGG